MEGGRCELFCESSPLLSGTQKEKEEWRGEGMNIPNPLFSTSPTLLRKSEKGEN